MSSYTDFTRAAFARCLAEFTGLANANALADADDDLSHALGHALSECAAAMTELSILGKRLRGTLDRIDGFLATGQVASMNGAGELQGAAGMYDAACARLVVARNLTGSIATAWGVARLQGTV